MARAPCSTRSLHLAANADSQSATERARNPRAWPQGLSDEELIDLAYSGWDPFGSGPLASL
jgi:hypothetical protein